MKKSPAMFLVMLGLWSLCLLYFNPRLIALLIGPEPVAAKLFLALFVIALDFFWFYIFFHIAIILFSYFSRNKNTLPSFKKTQQLAFYPKVALLYTTCNDFQEEAAYSHLKLDYPNYHLFILDDSSKQEHQNRIDLFAAQYADKITVIRRLDRSGFKAGNLNNALRTIDTNFMYFSVSDSDTILPRNYISALLPYVSNSSIAFAQTAQLSNSKQQTPFAESMRINTDIHFRRYASTKNSFGFVMWYGHGALMRRDVYEKIGGFPEIATEDLAYSMKAREAGYEGVFVKDVSCTEDFPPTYRQYRKRNEKWIRGTTECLLKFYPSFVKTAHIPWFEKMDVLVSAISLLTTLPFLIFLLLTGIILPLFFTNFQFQGPMFREPIIFEKTLLAVATQIQANLFWSWDVFLLMIASIFAPLVPVFIDYWRRPQQVIRYLTTYIFCFFSLQVVSSLHLIMVLFTGKAIFPVTGDCATQERRDPSLTMQQNWAQESQANLSWIFLLELAWATVFLSIGFTMHNMWFLPIATALCLSPCVFRWNLNSYLVKYAVSLPFVIILGIIYFIGKGLPHF